MKEKIRQKTIVWDDPKVSSRNADSISGLDYLKAIKEGKISPPPIANLIGYQISKVEQGRVAFDLDPEECHYNPFATVHGGIISTILDSAMTSSVLSTLPKGISCSTVEIKVNFIRPIVSATGILRCEARPVHIGRQLATAEGDLKDKSGTLYAHGVCTCTIFKVNAS